jgi:hypothetical protein
LTGILIENPPSVGVEPKFTRARLLDRHVIREIPGRKRDIGGSAAFAAGQHGGQFAAHCHGGSLNPAQFCRGNFPKISFSRPEGNEFASANKGSQKVNLT